MQRMSSLSLLKTLWLINDSLHLWENKLLFDSRALVDYLAGVAMSVVEFLSHLHYFSYNVESTRCALRDEKTETEQSGKS